MAKRQELRAIISADSRKFARTVGQVKRQAIMLVTGVAAIGAVGAAAFAKVSLAAASAGDEIGKSAKRIGVTNREFQKLDLMSQLAGASFGDLEKGFRKVQMTLYDAEKGSNRAAMLFQDLGYTMNDLKGKRPYEVFELMLKSLADIEDKNKRNAIASNIFGRAGTRLSTIVEGGRKEFDRMAATLERMPGYFQDKDIRNAEEFKDQLTLLGRATKGILYGLVFATFPQLNKSMDGMIARLAQIEKSEEFAKVKQELGQLATNLGNALNQFVGGGGEITGIADALKLVNKELKEITAGDGWTEMRETLLALIKLIGILPRFGKWLKTEVWGGFEDLSRAVGLVESESKQTGRSVQGTAQARAREKYDPQTMMGRWAAWWMERGDVVQSGTQKVMQSMDSTLNRMEKHFSILAGRT